jgi:hypothetical protein
VRRVNAAIDRGTLEDSVVDHIIAAESLLQKDAGSPDERTEKGFRLALRAAVLLATAGWSRREIFRAYEPRLGPEKPNCTWRRTPSEVIVLGRDRLPLHEFVEEMGDLMRIVLRKAVAECDLPEFGTGGYWEERILGPDRPHH